MRYFVTGATGTVGGAVVRRLLTGGHAVRCLVRDPARASSLKGAGADVALGTIADPNDILAAANGCEVAVHAAAAASARSSSAALSWVNIAGTENVLNGVRHAGCRRLVYVSCYDVTLVNEDRVHWNEDRGVSFVLDEHAHSKQLAEDLVLASSRDGFETVAIRPAVIWGPGDYTNLPLVCAESARGGFRLFGTERNLVSTTYIEHLVDALIAASSSPAAVGNAYYLTDMYFLEAREFYGAWCKAAQLRPPRTSIFPYAIDYGLSQLRARLGGRGLLPADVVHRGRSIHVDAARAMRDLGYEPRVTLEAGMDAVARWVAEVGGAEAVAKFARSPATDQDVDAIIAAAGGRASPSLD